MEHDLKMVVTIGHEKGIYPLIMTNIAMENHHAINR